MSRNLNSNQNVMINISRKNKSIYNINPNKDKRDVSYNNPKEKKDEKKTKEKVIYKRRNTEYDIPIPNIQIKYTEIGKMNLVKNRSRNYTEGNGGLYEGGLTRLYNENRKKYIEERNEENNKNKNNPKDNLLFGGQILEDLKSTNMRKISDNNKSETSRNSNKPNHSYYESHYSNGINKMLDKIDLKITVFKSEITKEIKEEILKSQNEIKDALLRVLGSISNSMKQLIDGQNKLIKLAEKK